MILKSEHSGTLDSKELFDSPGPWESKNIFDNIRRSCERVMACSKHVRIRHDKLAQYSGKLDYHKALEPVMDEENHFIDISYFLLLDAINFGSGYFRYLDLQPHKTGYFTVSSLLRKYYIEKGAPKAEDILAWDASFLADLFHQRHDNRPVMKLMSLFSTALNEFAHFIIDNYKGDFNDFVKDMDNSAQKMVARLACLTCFDDTVIYRPAPDRQGFECPEDFRVWFMKRAQITVSDLNIAYRGKGPGYFKDIDDLTIFADNLVPHVLWTDNVLEYSTDLEQAVQAGIFIDPGSVMETELRAAAVHCVELLKAEYEKSGVSITSQQLDYLLWNRGQHRRYRIIPPHSTLSIFY